MKNNVLGLVFGNNHADRIESLTSHRAVASVPFGGKYRLIDFNLSNMTNSGIRNIGIVVNKNFFSLMDHVGSGKSWDLSRKNGGVHLLPPYIQSGRAMGNSEIEAIYSIERFLSDSSEEYVLLCECGMVANIDYEPMIQQHIDTEADFTVMYVNNLDSEGRKDALTMKMNSENRVEQFSIAANTKNGDNVAVGAILTNKKLLMEIVEDCISNNKLNYLRDEFQPEAKKYR